MMPQPSTQAQRRLISAYVAALLLACVALGVLHLGWSDLRAGRVYWFNLDKERNLPTWFTGSVFFLLGCAACAAWSWERRLRDAGQDCFRASFLWLAVTGVAWLMSLDEITILHENLFWKETRLATAQLGKAWIHVTQWQVLFAVPALLVVSFLALFFWNRFGASRAALVSALSGLVCWITAHSLEGVRGTFKLSGPHWYRLEVLIEEQLEMLGAILLLTSVVLYVRDIALDLGPRHQKLGRPFLTRSAVLTAAAAVALLAAGFGVTYFQARRTAAENGAPPALLERAEREAAAEDSPPPDEPEDDVVPEE